jgi:hypothetical protein
VCHTLNERDENAAKNLKEYGIKILTRREKLTSVDRVALAAVESGSETAVGRPVREGSRKLVEPVGALTVRHYQRPKPQAPAFMQG